jgi:hypothetical protein
MFNHTHPLPHATLLTSPIHPSHNPRYPWSTFHHHNSIYAILLTHALTQTHQQIHITILDFTNLFFILQNTICCSFKSCCSWRWAHTPETCRAITPSTIKFYIVASSWFFHSQIIKDARLHKPQMDSNIRHPVQLFSLCSSFQQCGSGSYAYLYCTSLPQLVQSTAYSPRVGEANHLAKSHVLAGTTDYRLFLQQ